MIRELQAENQALKSKVEELANALSYEMAQRCPCELIAAEVSQGVDVWEKAFEALGDDNTE